MRRRTALAVLGMAVPVLGGCGAEDEAFLESWQRDGRAVPSSELLVGRWDAHCDDSVLYLAVRGPSGVGEQRWFVRDPEGLLAELSNGIFEPDADLPVGAEPTGLENDAGIELWLDPEAATAYLVDDDGAEAWPSLDEPLVCA